MYSVREHHFQQRGQAHLGFGVLGTSRGQGREHLGHGPQPLLADGGHQCRLVQRDPGHVIAGGRVLLHGAVRRPLHHLLDQELARTAALAGAGGVHRARNRRAAALHGGHERPFRDAVAVADLGAVVELGHAGLLTGPADVEQERDPLLRQGQPAVVRLRQVGHFPAVAQQRRAHHFVVADHDGLEDAAAGLGEDDVLVRVEFRSVEPHGGDVDAGHLELGGCPGAEVGRRRIGAGHVVGEHHGLFPQRRHQSVDFPAVLDALPHRKDIVLVLDHQPVIHHDGPFHRQPAQHGQVHVRPDPGGHHHHVARDVLPVPEADPGDAVGAEDGSGAAGRVHPDAQRLHAPPQHRAAVGPHLRIHEVPAGVHHFHGDAVAFQPVSGFQAQEAAADHHRPAVVILLGVLDHPARVIDGAEAENPVLHGPAGSVEPVHRRHVGAAAGGNDEGVVRRDAAVVGEHVLGGLVDPVNADPGVQRDAVLAVPGQGVEEDVGIAFLTGEDVAEHDPVVVAVGLVAEHGDGELVRASAGKDLLHGAGTGHPVAHHHQPTAGRAARVPAVRPLQHAGHQCSTMPRSTTTNPATPSGAATWSSTTEPPSMSSTTRSGTWTSLLAPMGK